MDPLDDELTRRDFLKVLGASIALAGLDGCTRMPAEKILPFVSQPPELTPGVPVHYATSMVLDGYATGLVVEAHEGRPTKVEGNPDHPASLGASGILEQASVLQLYDPDRARSVRQGKAASTWQAFAAAMAPARRRGRSGIGTAARAHVVTARRAHARVAASALPRHARALLRAARVERGDDSAVRHQGRGCHTERGSRFSVGGPVQSAIRAGVRRSEARAAEWHEPPVRG